MNMNRNNQKNKKDKFLQVYIKIIFDSQHKFYYFQLLNIWKYISTFLKFFVIDAGADESDGQDNQQLFSVVNKKNYYDTFYT